MALARRGMRFAIALGSNRGDRAATIAAALQRIAVDGIGVVHAVAPLCETAPVGCPPGATPFLNGAALIESDLGPHQVLHSLQRIETALGRARTVPGAARTIDLDLLLAEGLPPFANAVLTLPHPRLHERLFVLQPLAAIAADWWHPVLGRSVGEMATGYGLPATGDPSDIRRLLHAIPPPVASSQ